MLSLSLAVLLAAATAFAAQMNGVDVQSSPVVFDTGVSDNFTAQNIGPPFAHNFTFEVRRGLPRLVYVLSLTAPLDDRQWSGSSCRTSTLRMPRLSASYVPREISL